MERKFQFDLPLGWMPNVLERLRGTVVRIGEITSFFSEEQLSLRPEGKWSIKEHIGHLVDLEGLHEGRIDDFLNRRKVLRAADMSNALTHSANHNSKPPKDIIAEFTALRQQFILRLQSLDDDTARFQSLHPRLEIPMRPVDMACFTAEHDDHHLASIREICEAISNPPK